MLEEQNDQASEGHFSPVNYAQVGAQWGILQKEVHLTLMIILRVNIANPIFSMRGDWDADVSSVDHSFILSRNFD
jgi:hypothetical protein